MKNLPLALALPLALSTSVDAAVIASDDFSSPTSGTGWAPGDSWEGLNGGAVTVGFGNPGTSFRALAAPITASTHDKLYIALDFTHAGTGASWGGASFFEGAAGGNERFFIGDPGSSPNYGIVGYVGPGVDTGVPIAQGSTVRLIAELDFNADGVQSIYRMWVNSNDLNNPTAVGGPSGTPIETIGSMRLGSEGSAANGPITYDNLIVATTAGEVGLIPEPAGAVLAGLGGLLFGLRRRRD